MKTLWGKIKCFLGFHNWNSCWCLRCNATDHDFDSFTNTCFKCGALPPASETFPGWDENGYTLGKR